MEQKIKDISLDELETFSLRLAQEIRQSKWIPDHILYVERAGLFVGHTISIYFDCGLSGISCSRSGSLIKSRMEKYLRKLPRVVTHLLRNIEIKSNIHSIYNARRVCIKDKYPPRDKNLLIIDDAIDTGFSAKNILKFMVENGYIKDQIRMAVLTSTQKDPVCRADFSLFRQAKFAFPWSYDSREYHKAWSLYDDYKAAIL